MSLFIKNYIKYTRRKDLDIINDNTEEIFIEIKKEVINTNKNLIIGVVYRPPNTKFYGHYKQLDIPN